LNYKLVLTDAAVLRRAWCSHEVGSDASGQLFEQPHKLFVLWYIEDDVCQFGAGRRDWTFCEDVICCRCYWRWQPMMFIGCSCFRFGAAVGIRVQVWWVTLKGNLAQFLQVCIVWLTSIGRGVY